MKYRKGDRVHGQHPFPTTLFGTIDRVWSDFRPYWVRWDNGTTDAVDEHEIERVQPNGHIP